jgi:hypothetical protein
VSPETLLKCVVEALDGAGIDYMITGSVASSLQGEPRSTHDLDVVIAIEQRDVPILLTAFPRPQFYHDEMAVREAVRTGGMFNVIEVEEGDKIDWWLLTSDPFDQSRFARKYEEQVFGIRLKVSRAEDTILQKLRWVKASGGTERSYLDALRVYEVQARQLDLAYVEEWATRLGVQDLWTRILTEAEEV